MHHQAQNTAWVQSPRAGESPAKRRTLSLSRRSVYRFSYWFRRQDRCATAASSPVHDAAAAAHTEDVEPPRVADAILGHAIPRVYDIYSRSVVVVLRTADVCVYVYTCT